MGHPVYNVGHWFDLPGQPGHSIEDPDQQLAEEGFLQDGLHWVFAILVTLAE